MSIYLTPCTRLFVYLSIYLHIYPISICLPISMSNVYLSIFVAILANCLTICPGLLPPRLSHKDSYLFQLRLFGEGGGAKKCRGLTTDGPGGREMWPAKSRRQEKSALGFFSFLFFAIFFNAEFGSIST